MADPALQILIAEDEEARAACLRLRREVFIEEQRVPESEERDGLDDICMHFLARSGDLAVGAARVKPMDDRIAKIQRVCVSRPWRGKGVGADIMQFIVEVVRRDGRFSAIRLGSQTHALDFYRKLGFQEVGEEYLDAGIRHRDMELVL